jgi:hypothetical protein
MRIAHHPRVELQPVTMLAYQPWQRSGRSPGRRHSGRLSTGAWAPPSRGAYCRRCEGACIQAQADDGRGRADSCCLAVPG